MIVRYAHFRVIIFTIADMRVYLPGAFVENGAWGCAFESV